MVDGKETNGVHIKPTVADGKLMEDSRQPTGTFSNNRGWKLFSFCFGEVFCCRFIMLVGLGWMI